MPLRALVDLRGDGDAAFADAVEAEGRLAEHKHEIAMSEGCYAMVTHDRDFSTVTELPILGV